MCDVSVIIPVYNVRNEVLYQCVKSVSEQEEVDIEIFIIDDGSKAECAKFCDEFGKKDSRIKVIHQKNQFHHKKFIRQFNRQNSTYLFKS